MEDVLGTYAVRLLPDGRWQLVGLDESPVHPSWRVYEYADMTRRWHLARPEWPATQPPLFD